MKKVVYASLFVIYSPYLHGSNNGTNISFRQCNREISTCHDEISSSWVPLKEDIYEGLNNGIYWFRLELSPADHARIITIPESHITQAILYLNNQKIEPLPRRYLTFKVESNKNKVIYHLRVNCHLDARIPIRIYEQEEFQTRANKEFLIIGMYYGIVLSILFINLFSYVSFRNVTYGQYMLMAFGMAFNAFYKDGLLFQLIGRHGLVEVIEPTINSIVPITAIWFTNSYLSFGKDRPILYRTSVGLVLFSQVLNITLLLSGAGVLLFTFIDLVILIALDTYWITGISMWKKSFEAKLFTIAYGIPLFFAHDYYLFPHFGIKFLNLGPDWYKIGSVFEMVIFTYAIINQARRLEQENEEMKRKILAYTEQINQKNQLDIEATSMKLIKIYGFTLKEVEILKDLTQKKTNKEIAATHFISQNTVKTHIRNIFQKLEVNNREQAGKKFSGL